MTSGDPGEEVFGEEANGGEESASSGGEESPAGEGSAPNEGTTAQPILRPESEPRGERGFPRASPGNVQPKSTDKQPKELQPLRQPNKLLQPFGC